MGRSVEYKKGMRPSPLAFVLVAGSALAAPVAHAAPQRMLPTSEGWFFANAAGERSVVADGRLGGTPVWRTGVVLVRVTTPLAAEAVERQSGAQVVERLAGPGHVLRLDLGPHADDFAVSRALFERPDVVWAHPDLAFSLTSHAFPDDPYVDAQWHLENVGQSGGTVDADIDAEPAWALATGAGVVVSVVDSGVDAAHADLRVTCGYNYIEDVDDCYPTDGNAHGTAAAGLVAAIGNNGIGVAGVAYDADIFGVRLVGGSTSYSDLRGAFTTSVDAGAAVINNSWGFSDGCGSYALPGAIEDAFEYADTEGRGGLGSVIVFSAGNGDCNIDGDGLQSHPTVVSVAALDRNDRKEGYSSYGRWMDVAGPSGGVLTTDISGGAGYGSYEGDQDYTPGFSGTSASAPIVSGVLALMFSANEHLTADDARAVLCATADKVQVAEAGYDSAGWSETYGCGRVNAAAAVLAVANSGPEAPEPTGPTADPYADRVVLQWSAPTDPDGDPLRYTVSVLVVDPSADSTDSGDSGTPVEPTVYTDLTDTWLDLTDVLFEGAEVTWVVSASDAWTTSEAAEAPPFVVQPVPDPPEVPEDTAPPASPDLTSDVTAEPGDGADKGGCATAGGLAGGVWVLALALVGRRRA